MPSDYLPEFLATNDQNNNQYIMDKLNFYLSKWVFIFFTVLTIRLSALAQDQSINGKLTVDEIKITPGEKAIEFDGGDDRITIHDGFGNFNFLSGVDHNNKIVKNPGGTRLSLYEKGAFILSTYTGDVDSSASIGSIFRVDNERAYLDRINFGIGALNPESPLHIHQDGGLGFRLSRSGYDDYGLQLSAASGLAIRNLSDGRDEMVFSGDGKVGIGISSPAFGLDLVSTKNNLMRIRGGSSGYINAGVIMETTSGQDYRGSGTFYLDKGGRTEWFTGRPYAYDGNNTSDKFVIYRRSGTIAHSDLAAALIKNNGEPSGTQSFFVINNQGKVGIKKDKPSYDLDVAGTINANNILINGTPISNGGSNGNSLSLNANTEVFFADNGQIRSHDNYHRILFRRTENMMELREFGDIVFSSGASSSLQSTRYMIVKADGKVGIGKQTPDSRLHVDGRIKAEEIIVENVTGADFVFEEEYDLRSLEDTKAFVKANKHLPEVPSAAEMAEDGLELKKMNILLLQKIEELTLHVIDLNERIMELEESNKS